ncbi:hypothetical protein D3C72_1738080 [compost metagenome]
MLAVPLTVGRTARVPFRLTSPSRQPSNVPLPSRPSDRIGWFMPSLPRASNIAIIALVPVPPGERSSWPALKTCTFL